MSHTPAVYPGPVMHNVAMRAGIDAFDLRTDEPLELIGRPFFFYPHMGEYPQSDQEVIAGRITGFHMRTGDRIGSLAFCQLFVDLPLLDGCYEQRFDRFEHVEFLGSHRWRLVDLCGRKHSVGLLEFR